MQVIGISGKIGTGKSTLANYMADMLGWDKMSFGDPVKQEASKRFGFPIEWCYSEQGKNKHVSVRKDFIDYDPNLDKLVQYFTPGEPTVRKMLQWWGTDVRRKQDPDYWIKTMEKSINGNVIIDDVRFHGEAEMVKRLGGTLIRVEPYIGWECDEKIANHQSETDLDDYNKWDMKIFPDKGELKQKAEFITRTL